MNLSKQKLEQLIKEELSKKLNEDQGYIDKLVPMVLSGNPAETRQGLVFAETLDYIFDFVESDLEIEQAFYSKENWLQNPEQKARAVRFNAYPEFADALLNAFQKLDFEDSFSKLENFMMYPVPERPQNPDYYKFYFNIYDPDWGEELKFTPQGTIK